MSTWTYTMQGAPQGEPVTIPGEDEPGPALVRHRLREPGVCDLYTLASRNETFLTATYRHAKSGPPGEILAEMGSFLPAGEA